MATSVVRVNILGDARDLRRAFGDAERASKSFGSRIQDDLRSLGRLAVNAAKVIAGIGIALTGLILKGGISRALNIEDAQAKLVALGHDTETVEQVMESALNAVKGTAFGLDAAATAAAQAIAAGIAPGRELERVLKLTGDAASFMGNDFERSSQIINKVLAGNRLSMREVNQLHIAGVGILQMLSAEFGVTAGEMRKMVERGEIDSARFLQALESNIGGAALELGETTRGSLANVGAAFSRLGATLVEKFLPVAQGVFRGLIEGADTIASKVGPAMEAFANSDFFRALEENVKRIPEFMESATTAVVDFWQATELVRDNVGTAIKGLVAVISSEMGKAAAAVGVLILALNTLKAHPLIAVAASIGFAAGKIKEHVDSIQDPINEVKDRFAELDKETRLEVLRRSLEGVGVDVATLERQLARSGGSFEDLGRTTDGAAGLIERSGGRISDTWEEVANQIDVQTERSVQRIKDLGPAFEGSGSSAGEFEVKVGEAAEGVSGWTAQTAEDVEEMAAAADEAFTQMEDDVDEFITGFQEIPEETDLTLQKWIDNMNARNAAIQAWFDNLNFLRERGMNEFADEMEREGVEAASGMVQEAVDAIEDGNTGLPWLANRAAAGAEQVGERLAEGAAEGVNNRAGDLAASAEAMVRAALSRARTAAQVESPSELFAKELGEPIAEGVAKGIAGSDAPNKAISDKVGDMAATPIGGLGGRELHLHVQAWSDRFSLQQIEDELALHGVV